MKRYMTPDSSTSLRNPGNHILHRSPVLDRIYNEQLKNRKLSEKEIDKNQQKIFQLLDEASKQSKEEEAYRLKRIKSEYLAENKFLENFRRQQRQERDQKDLIEAHERNQQILEEMKSQREREIKYKKFIRNLHNQELDWQAVEIPPSANYQSPLKSSIELDLSYNFLKSELDKQIDHKQKVAENERLEKLKDKEIAFMIDQNARIEDERNKERKINEQVTLKAELDSQIHELYRSKNSRRNESYRSVDKYDTILNPVSKNHRVGRGRGFFSPFSNVANSIFNN